MKKKLLLLITLIASSFTYGAKADTLKIATASANLPFEFEDASGKTVGFEVDMMKLIGERLGMDIQLSSMPFNAIFSAVQSGRADVAIGSVTITPRRLESIAFAQPYFDSKQCLTVKTNGTINSLKDMKGHAVGVLTGSTGDIWATEQLAKYGFSEIRRYDTTTEPFLDIPSERIGGVIHDCPLDYYFIKDKPQYKIVDHINTNEQFSVFMKIGNPLQKQINDEITKLKQEGKLQEIYEKWFSEKPAEDSSSNQVTEIPVLK